MTLEEFLERVEHELRLAAQGMGHARSAPPAFAPHTPGGWQECQRCRLERLADEAADRAAAL